MNWAQLSSQEREALAGAMRVDFGRFVTGYLTYAVLIAGCSGLCTSTSALMQWDVSKTATELERQMWWGPNSTVNTGRFTRAVAACTS